MAYIFSLQAVLHLRRHKEAAEERALAALASHRQQLEATLGRVHQQISQWTEDRTREAGFVGTGLTQHQSYARLAVLQDAEKQLQQQKIDIQQRYAEQQERYFAMRSARETLTELEKGQRTAWEQACSRLEQRRVDDLVLGRWFR